MCGWQAACGDVTIPRYPPQLPEVTGKPLRDNAFPSRRHHIAAVRGGRWLLLGLAVALALPLPGAAQTTRETERKLQKLRTELKGVAQERRQIEGQRGQASQQLREADEKVARTGRALAQTEAALREQAQALAQAEQRRSSLQTNLAQQHRELAGLLRAAYQLGNHAPLKLLLSQDTVADANRALAYHRYLQRERAQRITTLTADLKELEALQAQIAERKQKLQGAQQDQKQQAAALAADRRDRAQTVASLDERFKDRREKEQALGQDAKALETLLANLRAAAARAEAERRGVPSRAEPAAVGGEEMLGGSSLAAHP